MTCSSAIIIDNMLYLVGDNKPKMACIKITITSRTPSKRYYAKATDGPISPMSAAPCYYRLPALRIIFIIRVINHVEKNTSILLLIAKSNTAVALTQSR